MINRLSDKRLAARCATPTFAVIASAIIFTSVVSSAWAQTGTLTPLATFGGGDGWLAPGESDYPYLTIGNTERGLAYGNGHLYLVSRVVGNNIRILDPATGVDPNTGEDLGGLNITGITTDGTFAVNMVGVAGDGAIYVGNLQSNTSAGVYKVYKWTDEAAAPTVAYSGNASVAGVRIGDDLAVIGSGSSTRLVSGFTGNSGYSIIDPTAGTANAVAFATNPPAPGDFRLGITFTDSSHVIGTQQGQATGYYRYTSFSGGTGTLVASPSLIHSGGATGEKEMAYDVINGVPLLAMQSTGDSHVAIYSLADPTNPVFLVSGNNAVSPNTNLNATGSIAWGPTVANGDGSFSASVYAMSSNQGIQAFTFTLQPAAAGVAGDYNHNGVVDAADYVLWRDTSGQTATPAGSGADGDGSGTVGPEDYSFWRARFGNTSGSGSLVGASVPEPASLVMCCLACGALCTVSRRRTAK